MADAEPATSSLPASLELSGLTLRRAGSVLLSGLSLRTQARRVGLVGDWAPLFQALTGQAELATGGASVFGCRLDRALARAVVGFAPCDPVLPGSFSVHEYLHHAARLSHGSSARAKSDTKRVLSELGLDRLVTHKLSQLAPHQRRALGVACAALSAPPVLCIEAPLRGLDAESADYIARLCAEAAKRSRIIVSAEWPSSPSPERALLEDCQELFVLQGGALLDQGSPSRIFAPGKRYAIRLKGAKFGEFPGVLRDAGCRVEKRSGVGNFVVELPESGTSDLLLDAALATELTVLELEPLFTNG